MVRQITSSKLAGSKTLILVRYMYLRDLNKFFLQLFSSIQLSEFCMMSNTKTLITSHFRDFQMKLSEFCIQSNSKLLIATNLKIFPSNFSSFVYSKTRKL